MKQKTIEVQVALSPELILTEIEKCYPQYFQSNNFSKELAIICDFREQQKASDLLGLSFIITDLESLEPFRQLRIQVKDKYKLGNREISYKGMRASVKRPSYVNSFINVADDIEGLLCNFVIDPSLDELIPEYYSKFTDIYSKYTNIKPKVFRKLNFMAHFISVLLIPLLSKDSVVHLISDQDNIFINPKIRDLSLEYILNTIDSYCGISYFKLAYIDPNEDTEDRYLKDLSSIPDLAIGALTDLVVGNIDDLRCRGELVFGNVKEKAASYSEWLFTKNKALRRMSFFIDLTGDNVILFNSLNSLNKK